MTGMFADVALFDIESAIRTIDSISENTKFKELQMSIITSIHNAVHAIVDYYERIDKSILEKKEDTLFRAFMYLNNQLKHDKELEFVTYNVSGSMFPIFFPFRSGPPGVNWADFKDNGKAEARGKREHYEDMLMNKDVRKSLEMARDIIMRTSGQKIDGGATHDQL